MEPDKRLEIVTACMVAVVFAVYLLDFPLWTVNLVIDSGVNFVISGVFYVFLVALGLDFLEDIRIGFVSVMTIAVYLTKTLII